MANKYSYLLRGSSYRNRKRLARQYDTIDNMPQLSLQNHYVFKRNVPSDTKRFAGELTDQELLIMSLVSTMNGVSAKQIKTYLDLMGYSYTEHQINKVLDILIQYNLVERSTISPYMFDNSSEDDGVDTKPEWSLKIYSRGKYKPFSERLMPGCTYKNNCIFKAEYGNTWSALSLTMHLANQVLLNHLIYGDTIKRFRIARIIHMKRYKLVIPLEIVTDDCTYFYINAVFLRHHKMNEILYDWSEYAKNNDGKIKLIFITGDDEHLKLTMNAVKNKSDWGFEIGFSVYKDYFRNSRAFCFARSYM